MNGPWKQALLGQLRERRILDEPGILRLRQWERGPWYAVLLSGLAAWLAALLLVGGTLVTLLDESPLAAGVAGLLLLGLAVWLLRQPGVFVSQLGLALSLTGQAMLVLAASQTGILDAHLQRAPAALALALAAGMLWAPAVAAHRMACALIAVTAGAALVGLSDVLAGYGLGLAVLAVWLWLQRSRWAFSGRASLYRALAGGATLLALALPTVTHGLGGGQLAALAGPELPPAWSWFYPLGVSALLLGVTLYLARSLQIQLRIGAVVAVLLLIVPGIQAPGLLVAAALGLAVFHACERFWMVLVGLGATLYLAAFYYGLHISLLNKSVLLIASGVVLLVLRGHLLRQWEQADED